MHDRANVDLMWNRSGDRWRTSVISSSFVASPRPDKSEWSGIVRDEMVI